MRKLLFFSIGSALMVQNGFCNIGDDLKNTTPNNPNWSQFKNNPYADLDLSNKDLTGIDLSGCTFTKVIFKNTNLNKVNLTNSTFTDCDMTDVKLIN